MYTDGISHGLSIGERVMGRLYWKFFAFFFFAQLTTVAGVSFAFWTIHHQENMQQEVMQQGMRRPPLFEDMPPPPMREDMPPPMREGMRPHIQQAQHRPPSRFPWIPLAGGFVVSFIFAAMLARYFSKPINNLKHAFEQAASGKLDIRVGEAMDGRRDELADLGRDFDAMATRLGSLLQGQTRLLHHVSHELRSPLARMQMSLGLARQNPEKINSTLDRIELEATRMDKMVGELLELSRLESGVVQLSKESLLLNHLLASIVSDAQFEADAKEIKLNLHMPKEYSIDAQADLLYRAIENVVRNAIKYAPEGSEVTIECSEQTPQKTLKINVRDQGIGVAETELEDIFKPFVRGSSGSQTTGHGVGLAITKQVIEAHGGHVTAKNLKPIGFNVEIQLPS